MRDVNYRGKYPAGGQGAVPLGPCDFHLLYPANFPKCRGLVKNLYANKNIHEPLFFFFFNLVSPPRRLAYLLMNWKIKNHRSHLPTGESYRVNTKTYFHESMGHT